VKKMSVYLDDNYNAYGCCGNRNTRTSIDSEVIVVGDCPLVHEQFSISLVKPRTLAPREDVIYRANGFFNCIGGGGAINPYGTIIVRNFSAVPVSFDVIGVLGTTTMIVQPNSEVALTLNSISEVNVNLPTDPVRLLFLFDIFYPANPAV
jgi:hypothetical protein